MELSPTVLDLDWQETARRIELFIKDFVKKTDAKGIVTGLSGGIDSCTMAALSARAIGGNKVLGLALPEKETRNAKDIEHARLVAEKFGLKMRLCDITPALEAFYKTLPTFDSTDKVCKGNIKARARMAYIYYHANKLNRIVCGSSDKSETMMGYFTKWGDVAADISPVADLYKTQVRKLAEYIGIPKSIIKKPSTPALWPGQTAEAELGMKYEQLDLILYGLEHFMMPEEIAQQLSVKRGQAERIKNRWLSTEHKRRMLLAPKFGYRTVGADFRLKRD